MADAALRILLVEDDEDDFVLTRDLLAEVPGPRFALEWAAGFDAGLAAATRGGHDVCLLDHRLGGVSGLELLRRLTAAGYATPVIMLTGQADRGLDEEALRAGAADYLVKGRLDAYTLERSIRYALDRHRHQEELRRLHLGLEHTVAERTEELRQANEALRGVDRRKDEFLAMLAHELRNPLAPIRNGLEILRLKFGADAAFGSVGQMMGRQLDHLVRLVDDLLDVSRLSHGKIELRKEVLDLGAAAIRGVETVRKALDAREHALTTTLAPDPVVVEADPTRVEQIVANLVSNAAKYTNPKGQIALTVSRVGDRAFLRVRDNGIGIRPEMLERIFDTFQQADRVSGQVSEGLGLGLSLVRRLAHLHGGSVVAYSAGLGRGSEFVVDLPVYQPDPPPGADAATSP